MFDGCGYARLYRNDRGKLERIDSFAIPERVTRTSFGFGDLSIHEFATDGNEKLAYSSYHSGGLQLDFRVVG